MFLKKLKFEIQLKILVFKKVGIRNSAKNSCFWKNTNFKKVGMCSKKSWNVTKKKLECLELKMLFLEKCCFWENVIFKKVGIRLKKSWNSSKNIIFEFQLFFEMLFLKKLKFEIQQKILVFKKVEIRNSAKNSCF